MNQAADPFDLDRIEKDVSDTAEAVQKVWIVFISFFSVFVILITTVDGVTLLRGTNLEVPLLKVSVPLTSFFFVAPCIAVCLLAYMLIQLLILSRKLGMYEEGVQSSIRSVHWRLGYRHRLGLSPFVHYFSGFDNSSKGAMGVLTSVFVIGTVIILPVVTLLLSLLTFLPYHDSLVLWINRVCVASAIMLLAIFWPKITRLGREELSNVPYWTFKKVYFATLIIYVLIAPLILLHAVFPGENLDTEFTREIRIDFPLAYIVADYDRGQKRKSLFYTSLVVKNRDDIWAQTQSRDLKDRNLVGAVLDGSNLDRANLTGANLQNASLVRASLREADMTKADLSLAVLDGAQMQGVTLREAEMVGASLVDAQAQGADMLGASLRLADLTRAQLQGASLGVAKLQGALLENTKLQGAQLDFAILIGAHLEGPDIRGASLKETHLEGISIMDEAKMDGASFVNAYAWRSEILSFSTSTAKIDGLHFDADPKLVLFSQINSPSYYDDLIAYLSGDVGDLILPSRHWRKPNGKITVREALESSTQQLRLDRWWYRTDIRDPEEETRLRAKSWEKVRSGSSEAFFSVLLGVFKDIACKGNNDFYFGSPYAAIGLVKFGRLKDLGPHEGEFKSLLSTPDQCIGATNIEERTKASISAAHSLFK